MADWLHSSLVGCITPVDRRMCNFSTWIVAIVLFQRDVVDFGLKRHTKMYMWMMGVLGSHFCSRAEHTRGHRKDSKMVSSHTWVRSLGFSSRVVVGKTRQRYGLCLNRYVVWFGWKRNKRMRWREKKQAKRWSQQEQRAAKQKTIGMRRWWPIVVQVEGYQYEQQWLLTHVTTINQRALCGRKGW